MRVPSALARWSMFTALAALPAWGAAQEELEVLPVQGNVYLIAGAGGNTTVQAGDTGVLNWMDTVGLEPGAFEEALFASPGRAAVDQARTTGREKAALAFPANREVLQRATGLIVHSAYAAESAVRWYGPHAADAMRRIPLLALYLALFEAVTT